MGTCAYLHQVAALLAVLPEGDIAAAAELLWDNYAGGAGLCFGAVTMGWSGFGGGALAGLAQHKAVVPSCNMQMVEDAHVVIGT